MMYSKTALISEIPMAHLFLDFFVTALPKPRAAAQCAAVAAAGQSDVDAKCFQSLAMHRSCSMLDNG
jgi:hypothetical protein